MQAQENENKFPFAPLRRWRMSTGREGEQSYMTVAENRRNNLKTRCSEATRERKRYLLHIASYFFMHMNIYYIIFHLYEVIGLKGNVNKQGESIMNSVVWIVVSTRY